MKKLAITVLAAAILFPAAAAAQIKAISGEAVTVTATVEAIDHTKRSLTLKDDKGMIDTITVPAEVKRFDTLKVGDKITAKYYENLVLRKKAPGEKDVNTLSGGVVTGSGAKAGGTASAQRTITATITAIDPAIPSITLSGPNNWKYSSKVEDKKALAQVKVGDKLDLTWTEAVLISAEAPTKK
jgi:hypothetical protein